MCLPGSSLDNRKRERKRAERRQKGYEKMKSLCACVHLCDKFSMPLNTECFHIHITESNNNGWQRHDWWWTLRVFILIKCVGSSNVYVAVELIAAVTLSALLRRVLWDSLEFESKTASQIENILLYPSKDLAAHRLSTTGRHKHFQIWDSASPPDMKPHPAAFSVL